MTRLSKPAHALLARLAGGERIGRSSIRSARLDGEASALVHEGFAVWVPVPRVSVPVLVATLRGRDFHAKSVGMS